MIVRKCFKEILSFLFVRIYSICWWLPWPSNYYIASVTFAEGIPVLRVLCIIKSFHEMHIFFDPSMSTT
jgi:hypothetical protein